MNPYKDIRVWREADVAERSVEGKRWVIPWSIPSRSAVMPGLDPGIHGAPLA